MTWLWLVRLALGAVDPCAPVAAAPRLDPASAAVYLDVADDERRKGDRDSALAAYREALRLDPSSARAHAGFTALCRADREPPAFDRGVERMDAGDRQAAIAAFEQARREGAGPEAALLEGICELEESHAGRARELLQEAARHPELASDARFFLGVLALNEGKAHDASELLSTAAESSDPKLAPAARSLLTLAERQGRLGLSAGLELTEDSNPYLLPDAGRTQAFPDQSAGLMAALALRPWGENGPFLRATGYQRNQRVLNFLDFTSATGAAGWQLSRESLVAGAEYGYDFLLLGGAPYLSAHRLRGAGEWQPGDFGVVAASYEARWESFLYPTLVGYSGLRHDAHLQAGARGELWDLRAGYELIRDGAAEPSLAYVEQGPEVLLRLRPSAGVRLSALVRYAWHQHDAFDPLLGLTREDSYLDGAFTFEVDLSEHFTFSLAALARSANSNAAAFTYARLAATASLSYAAAVW